MKHAKLIVGWAGAVLAVAFLLVFIWSDVPGWKPLCTSGLFLIVAVIGFGLHIENER